MWRDGERSEKRQQKDEVNVFQVEAGRERERRGGPAEREWMMREIEDVSSSEGRARTI